MAEKAEKKQDGIVETIKTVIYALVIAGVFRTLFFQPFWIPSSSMKDTLLIGDFLFVNKMAYGYAQVSCPFSMCPISGRLFGSEPERGEVVVFRHPVNGEDYIKRLIGMPGDKIKMTDGVLFINGVEAKQEPAGTFVETFANQGPLGSRPQCNNNPGLGSDCTKERFTETLPNGVSHSILNIRDSATGQHAGLYRARGALLLHGRQPRQLDGQPGVADSPRRRLCAVRQPYRSRGQDHVLIRRSLDAVLLDLAQRPVLQGDPLRLGADLQAFCARIGHEFQDAELLIRAVTHASIASETRPDNQRLEFLGDRVLGLVMAEALFEADRDASEGQLAPRFNALVRKETCADVAREVDLGAVLKLGRSEMVSGGRRKEALLADAIEAVIAAVYLDAGLDAARGMILRLWGSRIDTVEDDARDAKTALQEWAQARGQLPPVYAEVSREGPDHAPVFTIEAQLASGEAERASAPAKRQAEQAAAKALLQRVGNGT